MLWSTTTVSAVLRRRRRRFCYGFITPFFRHASSHTNTKPHSSVVVEVLRPGLVVVRRALSDMQQLNLTKAACALGARAAPDGFFDKDGLPNSRAYRGRIYSALHDYPTWVNEDVCQRSVSLCREKDTTMPMTVPTHVLLLCYMNGEGVGWHRDVYENDGEADKPVVTVNLGNSCDFIFKDDHVAPKTFLTLESGDVLLFGGPQRHAMHKVERVNEGTCPELLREPLAVILNRARRMQQKNKNTCRRNTTNREGGEGGEGGDEKKEEDFIGDTGRLSLTFRDAPTVVGREHEFASFKVDEHFDKDANFEWTKDRGLVGSQPGQSTEK